MPAATATWQTSGRCSRWHVRRAAGGPGVRSARSGPHAWSAVVRLVGSGAYGVVVVDTLERLAATETGRMAVLGLLRRTGVRLLVAREPLDTGDAIGRALADSLLDPEEQRTPLAA
ncbi:hypothetical protein Francci3_1953 [Frankia casuarinae]|uniref:Resolvase/invertase-type recombinase catalytic domain-containing protein n=1 Tax=Frankia casuarinae (strain DSM 45818 / CECT 9043 / HFP020203 / CcI3) TaxID=106370 RepID=Q2JBL4_FRACC|nr:hypothetical protein Francci3_1953 [Frankia casuarinae]